MVVKRGDVEINIGMKFRENFNAFGGSYECHEANRVTGDTAFLKYINGVRARIARGYHRIDDDEGAAVKIRKLHHVLDWTVILITIKTDVTDTGRRHQCEKTVRHA